MGGEYTVEQDGADFYLKEGSALIAVVTYPSGVRDMNDATRAREWFHRLAAMWGWRISL